MFDNNDILHYRSSNALPLEDWHTSSAFIPSLPLPPNPESVRDVRIVVKSLPGAGPRLSGGLNRFCQSDVCKKYSRSTIESPGQENSVGTRAGMAVINIQE